MPNSLNNDSSIDFYKYFEYRTIETNLFEQFEIDNATIVNQCINARELAILPPYYTKLFLLPPQIQKNFVQQEIEKTLDFLCRIDFNFNETLISAYFNDETFYSPEDIVFNWLDVFQIKEYRKHHEGIFDMMINKEWSKVPLPKFTEVTNAIVNLRYLTLLKWHLSLLNKGKKIKIKNPLTHITHSLDENQLGYLYNHFTKKIDLIDEFRTTYSDFTNVFNKSFSESNSKIYWNGETKQVAYFLHRLKKDAEYTYVSIEKSQKFITLEGTILTATNISKGINDSKGMRPKEANKIDSILKSMPRIKQ